MVCEVERQRGGSCFLVATCVIPRHFFLLCSCNIVQCRVFTRCWNAAGQAPSGGGQRRDWSHSSSSTVHMSLIPFMHRISVASYFMHHHICRLQILNKSKTIYLSIYLSIIEAVGSVQLSSMPLQRTMPLKSHRLNQLRKQRCRSWSARRVTLQLQGPYMCSSCNSRLSLISKPRLIKT